jgi:hypothetical protein
MSALALVGLLVMAGSEAATLARVEPFWSWNTPIAWTGFILFADSIVFDARGASWLRSAKGEFLWLSVASIPLWLVFEFYNRFIDNWYYVGLPKNTLLRYFGYAWSFATIWPAIFEGADLVAVWRARLGLLMPSPSPDRRPPLAPSDDVPRRPSSPQTGSDPLQPFRPSASDSRGGGVPGALLAALGAALLLWPLLWPSRYLAAPVWLGFILLLDPINARVGGEAIVRDVNRGDFDRVKNLMASGFLCGVLWEFWNYWARAKWHYTVPIMERFKVFEMPVPGYLGFPAFALECFTMYVFLRLVVARVTGRTGLIGRAIGR